MRYIDRVPYTKVPVVLIVTILFIYLIWLCFSVTQIIPRTFEYDRNVVLFCLHLEGGIIQQP